MTKTGAGRGVRAATGSVASWLIPAVLFLAVFGVYSATAARPVVDTDAYAASVGAWRIASTGSPWLDRLNLNRLAGTHGVKQRGTWLGKAPNGHVVAQRMAGPILVGVPFYWLLDRGIQPRTFSVAAGGIAASFVTALAVLLLFLGLRRSLNDRLAVVVALAFALGTPTWSVSANGLWTHTVTQFGLAGVVYALARQRLWLTGMFFGVGMFGRPHLAVVAAILGLGLSWAQRRPLPAIAVGVPTALAVGALEVWNRMNFGVWSLGGAYGDARIVDAATGVSVGETQPDNAWTNLLGFMFSANRGFLVWTPLLLVMVPALIRSWRSLPLWARLLPVGGAAYTVIQLQLNYFSGGIGFYGYRHGLELLTCLVPALAWSVRRMSIASRALAVLVLCAQVGAIALGAVVEAFFLPQKDVWTENAFWVVMRHQPSVVGAWLALCLLVGAVGSTMVIRRTRSSTSSSNEYREALTTTTRGR